MSRAEEGGRGRCHDDIHCREMVARVRWAVRLRWIVVVACLAGGVFLPLAGLPSLAGRCFLAVGLFLGAVNTLLRRRLRSYGDNREQGEEATLRALCLLQVVSDHVGLSVVNYALGSVETPVMFLLLPNCILVALYFPPLQSLAVSLLGLALALLPLVLELAGVVPVMTIFGPIFKGLVTGSLPILGGYLSLLALCVLFCWYLASVIRESLLANEEEIEARYLDLLRLNRERTVAVLRGTHELKAPLAAIRSTASTLRDGYGGPLPDKALHMVGRIGSRCDHLLTLITDVIRLGNLQSAVRVGEALHAVDLCRVLAEEVEEASAIGRPRQVAVRLSAPAGPVWARASEEHLRTLFGNLLANGVQYSRPGGEVAVAVAVTAGRATVTVRDQGIGIPAEALPRVFDEHYRAVNAVRHHEGGTGLGLSIVRAIADLLGARIEVASEIDRGAVFTVTFSSMESQGGTARWPES